MPTFRELFDATPLRETRGFTEAVYDLIQRRCFQAGRVMAGYREDGVPVVPIEALRVGRRFTTRRVFEAVGRFGHAGSLDLVLFDKVLIAATFNDPNAGDDFWYADCRVLDETGLDAAIDAVLALAPPPERQGLRTAGAEDPIPWTLDATRAARVP